MSFGGGICLVPSEIGLVLSASHANELKERDIHVHETQAGEAAPQNGLVPEIGGSRNEVLG